MFYYIRGFFPKGGGSILINIEPVKNIEAVELTEPGKVVSIKGLSYVGGNVPARVGFIVYCLQKILLHCKK